MDCKKTVTAHPVNALTAVGARNMKTAGRYADGNGLYLIVDNSGAKRWVLRVTVNGKRCDIGLGGLRTVSLADARVLAADLRKQARQGGDPLAKRRQERRVVPTFAMAAERVHAERSPTFKNPKHAAQWLQTIKTYVLPVFGSMPVDQVSSSDVLKVLTPIWIEKPETARRVRQRIRAVFSWCKAHKYFSGDNPTDDLQAILPEQAEPTKHFAAMPYADLPKFIQRLRVAEMGTATQLGIELLVLTFLRTGEVRQGRWTEIDFDVAVWTVPMERQLKKRKHAKPHVVPLSPRAVEILHVLRKQAGGSPFIFPGRKGDKPISDMTFLMGLRRMGVEKDTIHGFRSSARDWGSEETSHSSEVIEMALTHSIGNKVEAAYRRGELLAKRRALMTDWANYVSAAPAPPVKETAA